MAEEIQDALILLMGEKQAQQAQPMDEAALRALVKELVRQELESLDERIEKRIEAALRRSVLALRPQVRNMEYK